MYKIIDDIGDTIFSANTTKEVSNYLAHQPLVHLVNYTVFNSETNETVGAADLLISAVRQEHHG